MIRLDAATVLLQWAAGGLLFLWVTTRRREVGIGYGWLLRSVYGVMALAAVVAGRWGEPNRARDVLAALTAGAAAVALADSVTRRKAGVAGERQVTERRRARVAAMTGEADAAASGGVDRLEFRPALDAVAPVLAFAGVAIASLDTGGPVALALARNLVGAVFLGVVSDAMLLGHWYLVQPGLPRAPLLDLVAWLARIWPLEVAALVWPTGMLSVISGAVDDGYNGVLGWFWLACAVTTIGLTGVTVLALRERAYSAVMAATGLLYLAILTAFGTDLVGRAVLAG